MELDYIELTGQEAKHASRVLRKKEGDTIILNEWKRLCKATAKNTIHSKEYSFTVNSIV